MMKPLCSIAVAALVLAGCAYGPHRHGGPRYGSYYGPEISIVWGRTTPFAGPGVVYLDPWLRYHPDGHIFVYRHLDIPQRHQLTRREAERANRAFRERADANRDYRLEEREIREALRHRGRD